MTTGTEPYQVVNLRDDLRDAFDEATDARLALKFNEYARQGLEVIGFLHGHHGQYAVLRRRAPSRGAPRYETRGV